MASPCSSNEFIHVGSFMPDNPPTVAAALTTSHQPPAISSSYQGPFQRGDHIFGEHNPQGEYSHQHIYENTSPENLQVHTKSAAMTSPHEVPLSEETSTLLKNAANEPLTATKSIEGPAAAAPFANGYHFPPKHSFAQSSKEGALAAWNYVTTPLGFCITIYGLNIVAWGGMLFLLLCNASPAMCYPTCNDINSPRRKWIEWDSQILNALFCITGFGLAPWRFRDLYLLLRYRLKGELLGLRKLAAIHNGWFRLSGSETLPVYIGPDNVNQEITDDAMIAKLPSPQTKIANPPETGVRAPATPVWKMDLVIWLMVWNTLLQVCLAVFMWGWNRINRPSWSTGLFVALACVVAMVGGYIMFQEGRAVKSVEGVAVSDQDKERLEKDRELGVWHYNNIKDKDLTKKEKSKK